MSQTMDPSTAEKQGGLKVVSGKDRDVAPSEAPQGRRVLEVAAQEAGGVRPARISHRTAQGHLRIEAWLDPVVEEMGHDPRSAYAEMYWLPVLGPSVTWMLRRFANYLEESPEGADLGLEELARSLGIGERNGPNGPLARTLKRCVDFQMAEWRESSLAVRRRLPPLARRHLRRLPESLQARHFEEVESVRPCTASERLRIHGCRLALSLMQFGEDRAAAEQQLVRWAFHPGLASACATWAALEHSRRSSERTLPPAGSPHPAGSARNPTGSPHPAGSARNLTGSPHPAVAYSAGPARGEPTAPPAVPGSGPPETGAV